MNVLSVAAAYGVLVIVFQWGWFDGFLGFESLGYVQAITPALLLAVVFGLIMDYEVFMLSRIKERYQATGDNQQAVAAGPGGEREDDLERRADHGRRVRDLRRHRRAAGQGDRRRPGGGDRARRHDRAARPRPDDDGADGRLRTGGCRSGWTGACPTWTSSPRPATGARDAGGVDPHEPRPCSSPGARPASAARPPSGSPRTAGPSTRRRAGPESIADLEAAGCKTLALDVNSEESMAAAVRVEAAEGAIGALVNNAGIQEIGAIETRADGPRARRCSRPTSSGRCGSPSSCCRACARRARAGSSPSAR